MAGVPSFAYLQSTKSLLVHRASIHVRLVTTKKYKGVYFDHYSLLQLLFTTLNSTKKSFLSSSSATTYLSTLPASQKMDNNSPTPADLSPHSVHPFEKGAADQVSNTAQLTFDASARTPVAISDTRTPHPTPLSFDFSQASSLSTSSSVTAAGKEHYDHPTSSTATSRGFLPKPSVTRDSPTSSEATTTTTAPAAQHQGQDYGPKSPMSKSRQMVVFLGILMVLFLAALDQSIVTTALPSISKDFNNFSEISWVGTGFLLTMTAIQPLYGVAADLAGRKRTM